MTRSLPEIAPPIQFDQASRFPVTSSGSSSFKKKKPVKSRGVDPEEKYRRDRAIIYLFTYAGLRVHELSNLKLRDIDLDLKRVRIVGKGKKIRTIPISNTLLIEIQDWLTFRADR